MSDEKKNNKKPINALINIPFDQLPHVIFNHPQANPEHIVIMIALFKVLKDKPQCTYPDETLSENCRIPLRTIQRRLPELEKMGFIIRTGRTYGRRIKPGLLLTTTAILADKNKNNTNSTVQNLVVSAKSVELSAKSCSTIRHDGGYTNISTNRSTNRKDFLNSVNEEYGRDAFGFANDYLNRRLPLPPNLAHLKPELDRIIESEKK